MKILVVGSGTAGLIAALILKKFLNCTVDVVHSKNIGIIGVGEGSTEHFDLFLNFLNISQYEIIQKCNATYKSGILFDNWSDKQYMHHVSPPYSEKFGGYSYFYASQIIKQSDNLVPPNLIKNKINSWFINKPEEKPFYQFHFDTYLLNDFLTNLSIQNKINIFEDEIDDIVLKENGEIDYLLGKNKNYCYDFYIDASGFKKMLIKKMGAKWISASKYLKMKSAIVFPTGDEDEYNLWTLSRAMNYGWRFKIPTWGRHGNGYIFDSDYIDADKAKEELDKEFGYDVEISKEFKFDPGYLDRAWIKNCVAIGLSGSFFEPLEATSIGSSIQQSFLLMNKIFNYSENDISDYNQNFIKIMENIRDFVALHYLTNKTNSDFWNDITIENMPDSLVANLKLWKKRMPIFDDLNTSRYNMFYDQNFIVVMNGLNLFDIESITKQYNFLPENKKNDAFLIELEQNNFYNNIKTIGHKNFLKIIRQHL